MQGVFDRWISGYVWEQKGFGHAPVSSAPAPKQTAEKSFKVSEIPVEVLFGDRAAFTSRDAMKFQALMARDRKWPQRTWDLRSAAIHEGALWMERRASHLLSAIFAAADMAPLDQPVLLMRPLLSCPEPKGVIDVPTVQALLTGTIPSRFLQRSIVGRVLSEICQHCYVARYGQKQGLPRMAARIGVHPSALRHWMSGRTLIGSREDVVEIGTLLGIEDTLILVDLWVADFYRTQLSSLQSSSASDSRLLRAQLLLDMVMARLGERTREVGEGLLPQEALEMTLDAQRAGIPLETAILVFAHARRAEHSYRNISTIATAFAFQKRDSFQAGILHYLAAETAEREMVRSFHALQGNAYLRGSSSPASIDGALKERLLLRYQIKALEYHAIVLNIIGPKKEAFVLGACFPKPFLQHLRELAGEVDANPAARGIITWERKPEPASPSPPLRTLIYHSLSLRVPACVVKGAQLMMRESVRNYGSYLMPPSVLNLQPALILPPGFLPV